MISLKTVLAAASVTLVLMTSATFAHTYHTSLTRVDYNREAKLLEIDIQLFLHDVQPMLERRLKKRVDVAKTPEVDAELLKYVRETLVIFGNDGKVRELKWVGKEFDADVLHVYVEVPAETEPSGWRMKNVIFLEAFETQTNYVVFVSGDTKKSLLFKSGETEKSL